MSTPTLRSLLRPVQPAHRTTSAAHSLSNLPDQTASGIPNEPARSSRYPSRSPGSPPPRAGCQRARADGPRRRRDQYGDADSQDAPRAGVTRPDPRRARRACRATPALGRASAGARPGRAPRHRPRLGPRFPLPTPHHRSQGDRHIEEAAEAGIDKPRQRHSQLRTRPAPLNPTGQTEATLRHLRCLPLSWQHTPRHLRALRSSPKGGDWKSSPTQHSAHGSVPRRKLAHLGTGVLQKNVSGPQDARHLPARLGRDDVPTGEAQTSAPTESGSISSQFSDTAYQETLRARQPPSARGPLSLTVHDQGRHFGDRGTAGSGLSPREGQDSS